MSKWLSLVERHEKSPTVSAKVDNLLKQVVNEDKDALRQIQVTGKRNSVEGSVPADVYALAAKVRALATEVRETEVVALPLEAIAKRIKLARQQLELDAVGQKSYMELLAREAVAKGLTVTQGNA